MTMNLDQISALWDSTPCTEQTDRASVPDGKYKATINTVMRKIITGKNGEMNVINWDLIIEGGDYANRHVFHTMFLTSEKAVIYTKELFGKLGYDVKSFNELDSYVFPTIVGGIADIQLKMSKPNGDYEAKQSVFINKITPVSAGEENPF